MAPLRAVELDAWQAALRRDEALRHDPALRSARGIVHTPPALARAVVNVLDELLRERFLLTAGICDERVQLVDPACGPGAFLAALLARAESSEPPATPRMTGFDLDPAALDSARALLQHPAATQLQLEQGDMLDGEALCALAAGSDRVLAVVGNPPWSTARAQSSPAAQRLLEDFRQDAVGVRLPERKLGVLSDAYVRFFRVCAEAARLARAGAVLGVVSNGSFLDGPVHRGMRAALLRWFDEVFVLDLGGSALLERMPGTRDDNVFGVRPSVAITWLCRHPRAAEARVSGRVHYARLSGDKASKLERLSRCVRADFAWCELQPQIPLVRFVPTRRTHAAYASAWSLADCVPFHREGVQSNRDAVVVDDDRGRLLRRLRALASGDTREVAELNVALQPLAHYDPALARARLREALERDPDGSLGISLQRIAYRPLDERYFCPVTPLCHRPRSELLAAMQQSPLALVSVRKDRGSSPWTHSAASAVAIDNCYLSTRSSCRARAFPVCTPDGRDNLAAAVREQFSQRAGTVVDALSFTHYALGCMSAASYRARWDDELRQDYPRITLPPTAAAFQRLSSLGRELAELFVEPLVLGGCEPAPDRDARYSDLAIDAAGGGVRLRGEVVCQASPEALALCVGHHRPLAAYISARGQRVLDGAALSALRARADRLERMAAVATQIDGAYCEAFA